MRCDGLGVWRFGSGVYVGCLSKSSLLKFFFRILIFGSSIDLL